MIELDSIKSQIDLFNAMVDQELKKALSQFAGYEITKNNVSDFLVGKSFNKIETRNNWHFFVDDKEVLCVENPRSCTDPL